MQISVIDPHSSVPVGTPDQVRAVKKAIKDDPSRPPFATGLAGKDPHYTLELRHTTLKEEEAALKWLGQLKSDHPAVIAAKAIAGGLVINSKVVGVISASGAATEAEAPRNTFFLLSFGIS